MIECSMWFTNSGNQNMLVIEEKKNKKESNMICLRVCVPIDLTLWYSMEKDKFSQIKRTY